MRQAIARQRRVSRIPDSVGSRWLNYSDGYFDPSQRVNKYNHCPCTEFDINGYYSQNNYQDGR